MGIRGRRLGETFLRLPAISAYGIWVILWSFPLALAGLNFLIDERRSPGPLLLSSLAIGIVAASYTLRFYLVRNTERLKTRLRQAESREQAIEIISGGVWWWLITLLGAIAAAIGCRHWF